MNHVTDALTGQSGARAVRRDRVLPRRRDVALVLDDQALAVGCTLEKILIDTRDQATSIQYDEDEVARAQRLSGSSHSLGFDRVRRFAQASSVDDPNTHPVDHQRAIDQITCGPRGWGDNGPLGTEESIQQARLTDIRRPCEHHGEPVLYRATTSSPGDQSVQTFNDTSRFRSSVSASRASLVVGEVERTLEACDEIEHGAATPAELTR